MKALAIVLIVLYFILALGNYATGNQSAAIGFVCALLAMIPYPFMKDCGL